MLILGHLVKTQKDIWDILQVISALLIPIVIGVATYRIQKSIAKQSARVQKSVAEQSVAKDYVGMAVSILEKPNDDERSALRDWAVELLNEKSPLKFTPEQ